MPLAWPSAPWLIPAAWRSVLRRRPTTRSIKSGCLGPIIAPWVGAGLRADPSLTHFFVKLVFAAPANFFSFAEASQAVVASRSHFLVKLVSAAPASFFSAACALHEAVCAEAADVMHASTRPITTVRIEQLPSPCEAGSVRVAEQSARR